MFFEKSGPARAKETARLSNSSIGVLHICIGSGTGAALGGLSFILIGYFSLSSLKSAFTGLFYSF
jgi:hypothetical protein